MQTRTFAVACLLDVVLIGCGGAALAMNVEETEEALARSVEGATLYEIRRHGPEGGGSLSYRVQGRAPRDSVDFLVSSDFGSFGPHCPQTVSEEACRQRLAALGTELAKRKIVGVTLYPDGCRSDDRSGLVIVAKPDAPSRR